jgi:UDP-glucose 4-epimerase
MNAFVTGGAGFIGSHLVDALVKDERFYKVVVIDNYRTGLKSNLEHLDGQFIMIEDSISREYGHLSLREYLREHNIDVIFHLAAAPGVPISMKEPDVSHIENVVGTFNILEAARQEGIKRVIFSSSSSIYGGTASFPTVESANPMMEYNPKSPYAQFKMIGEHYCKMYSSLFGVDTVCLRYFNIFGPRQRADSPYAAVIASFLDCAANDKTPTIHGDGENFRDFTYVENAVHANILAATHPNSINGESFNVGTGGKISINEVHVASEAKPAQYVEARVGDVIGSQASIDKISSLLGYKVLVDFKEGMRRTKEWHNE